MAADKSGRGVENDLEPGESGGQGTFALNAAVIAYMPESQEVPARSNSGRKRKARKK